MSDIYLIYPSDSTDDRLGVMKVYHGMNDLKLRHTKRELLALRTLESKLLLSNECLKNDLFSLYRT